MLNNLTCCYRQVCCWPPWRWRWRRAAAAAVPDCGVLLAASGRPVAGAHVVRVPLQLQVVAPDVVRRPAAADRLGHELPAPGMVGLDICQQFT